ncbi:hypothetical protein [Bifidobacterium platyrrhinorum]|uniref:DUF3168 domain-containing protein n=1 Tax=Bifidobacterium platyrrhinorum TaxID=2661628 RepID=A0A6L9SQI4_9BIFI|nr:hypothetical protein [Bifidobacterium platyrrhinorum]NEG54758.1 hypothetical protein [Bifidobacterium platyrrhinorum]
MLSIETTLVQFLNRQPELTGIPVSTDVPPQRPERFVTVERVGGDETPFTDHPMLAIQCWGTSRMQASFLAQRVKTLLERATRIPAVARVRIESTLNDPLDEHTPRYQITAELTVHKHM